MDKKAATYKRIFSELKSIAARKGTTFAPSLIMTDFESGVITAIKAEVSRFCLDKRINFFHLCIRSHFSSHRLGIFHAFFSSAKPFTDRSKRLVYNSNIRPMNLYAIDAAS